MHPKDYSMGEKRLSSKKRIGAGWADVMQKVGCVFQRTKGGALGNAPYEDGRGAFSWIRG
jgi:hypothetical protein